MPGAINVELVLAEGDAVPGVASFLFFDLLFESLARESCSCYVSQLVYERGGSRLRGLKAESKKIRISIPLAA